MCKLDKFIYIYIYIYIRWSYILYLLLYIVYFILYIINCLCGSVVKASYTQAVGHGFDPRPDH